jgi:excisionase family DNA binding protein
MPTPDHRPSPPEAILSASFDTSEIAHQLRTSHRTVRRLDALRAIPGRFTIGRLVRYHRELVLEWIAAGCPVPDTGKGVVRG